MTHDCQKKAKRSGLLPTPSTTHTIMKNAGYALITLGFLGGALASVVTATGMPWGYFGAALAVGVVGIALVRVGQRQIVEAEGATGAGMQELKTRLDLIVANIIHLNAEKATLDPYAIRGRIDELFRDDLAAFMDARESISHVHSLQAYANVMSHMAAGERYLNRVWSASADGYADEALDFLDKTEEQFIEAKAQFDGLGAEAAW